MSYPTANADLRGYRVLLIEDERVVREIILRMLKAIGVTDVIEARSAEDAWVYLVGDKCQPFHVIMTDLTLPGVSGGAMIKMLRGLPSMRAKTMPIIVLTGSADLETYRKVESSRISSYLIKPISSDILRAALEKAVIRPALAGSA